MPVGNSVKDVDLRGTAFNHLKAQATSTPDAPVLSLSPDGFPQAAQVVSAEERSAPQGTFRPMTIDPMQLLVDRAKTSWADATLFIRLTPMFRAGVGRGAMVESGAWLYDRSGKQLFSWAPVSSDPQHPTPRELM